MVSSVVETSQPLTASPRDIATDAHIRIPKSEQEYVEMLDDCKHHGCRRDCAFCITFAREKVEELRDSKALKFLMSIPAEVQQLAVDAVHRFDRTLLQAAVKS